MLLIYSERKCKSIVYEFEFYLSRTGQMNSRANNIKLPLYMQISELLAREINAGIWPDGGRLPTEADLAAKLNCAVGTLRKALAELEQRGALERIQGSGTYVRLTGASKSIYSFFHLELNSGGGLPSAEIVDLSRQVQTDALPDFGGQSGAHAWRIRRLRCLDSTPSALEEIWFDARHIEHLEVNQISESLHQFYKDHLDFWISHVEDRVSVGVFPDWTPSGSRFVPGSNCGLVSRVSHSNTGYVEEFSQTWFDPNLVHYNARWR